MKRHPLERLVRQLWEAIVYGAKQMTPTQLARRIERGERWTIPDNACCDCGEEIELNDDAGLCTSCGGYNLRVERPNP